MVIVDWPLGLAISEPTGKNAKSHSLKESSLQQGAQERGREQTRAPQPGPAVVTGGTGGAQPWRARSSRMREKKGAVLTQVSETGTLNC